MRSPSASSTRAPRWCSRTSTVRSSSGRPRSSRAAARPSLVEADIARREDVRRAVELAVARHGGLPCRRRARRHRPRRRVPRDRRRPVAAGARRQRRRRVPAHRGGRALDGRRRAPRRDRRHELDQRVPRGGGHGDLQHVQGRGRRARALGGDRPRRAGHPGQRGRARRRAHAHRRVGDRAPGARAGLSRADPARALRRARRRRRDRRVPRVRGCGVRDRADARRRRRSDARDPHRHERHRAALE